MRALTLFQPWAWLVASGQKTIENRPVAPPGNMVGEYFAIHAGKTYDDEAHVFITSRDVVIPMVARTHGALVGIAKLEGWARGAPGQMQMTYTRDHALSDVQARILTSPWFFGPVGYLLSNIVQFPEPVACRGAQGFWPLPPDVQEAVFEQVPSATRVDLYRSRT